MGQRLRNVLTGDVTEVLHEEGEEYRQLIAERQPGYPTRPVYEALPAHVAEDRDEIDVERPPNPEAASAQAEEEYGEAPREKSLGGQGDVGRQHLDAPEREDESSEEGEGRE